jgi:hypothetical protein
VVIDPQHERLRERALQPVCSDGGGEIQQRARDRGDRDGLVRGGVSGIEGSRPV